MTCPLDITVPILTPAQQLNAELIDVLGNTTTQQGRTCSQILQRLQSRYPDSGWTMVLVNNLVRSGLNRGRLSRSAVPRSAVTYNRQMSNNNPNNRIYQQIHDDIAVVNSRTTHTTHYYHEPQHGRAFIPGTPFFSNSRATHHPLTGERCIDC